MAFWTLIVILIQSKRTPTHSEVEDHHLENSDERLRDDFVSDTNSIIGFGACEASIGETQVLLLVNETWIWTYMFPGGDRWSCASVAGDGTETISVQ